MTELLLKLFLLWKTHWAPTESFNLLENEKMHAHHMHVFYINSDAY